MTILEGVLIGILGTATLGLEAAFLVTLSKLHEAQQTIRDMARGFDRG